MASFVPGDEDPLDMSRCALIAEIGEEVLFQCLCSSCQSVTIGYVNGVEAHKTDAEQDAMTFQIALNNHLQCYGLQVQVKPLYHNAAHLTKLGKVCFFVCFFSFLFQLFTFLSTDVCNSFERCKFLEIDMVLACVCWGFCCNILCLGP